MTNLENIKKIIDAINANARRGSFAQCTARFRGQRDHDAVEVFLLTISVYKDIEHISDEDALRGMPLLLEGDAAYWWMGVKESVANFDDVKKLLRDTFAPSLPDWQIMKKIFETKQQDNENIHSFLHKQRILFAQLKNHFNEEMRLNMVYGLLTFKIREKVRRDTCKNFQELFMACREAEFHINEANTEEIVIKDVTNSNHCKFCHHMGHTIGECSSKGLKGNKIPVSNQKPTIMKIIMNCYICGAPGVSRSECPTCNSSSKGSSQHFAFNSISSKHIDQNLPIVQERIHLQNYEIEMTESQEVEEKLLSFEERYDSACLTIQQLEEKIESHKGVIHSFSDTESIKDLNISLKQRYKALVEQHEATIQAVKNASGYTLKAVLIQGECSYKLQFTIHCTYTFDPGGGP